MNVIKHVYSRAAQEGTDVSCKQCTFLVLVSIAAQVNTTTPRHWTKLLLCALSLSSLLAVGNPAIAKAATCANLVVDSSLENGSGWITKSSGNYPLLSSRLTHSGKQAAYLAGTDNAHDLLSPMLKLPAGQPSITLNFWWQIQSQESNRFQDSLTVVLTDSQGKALQTLDTLSSRDMSNQWQQHTFALTKFVGQTVQIQFVARTDGEAATDFFIDDVEVVACN